MRLPCDHTLLRIRLESEAKLTVQDAIRSGIHSLIWSYVLDYENSRNPFPERSVQIGQWKSYAIADDGILKRAQSIPDIIVVDPIGFLKEVVQ